MDGFKQNAQTLEKIGSSWIDWRDWNDTTLDELVDTLIFDARKKEYWWGNPQDGMQVSGVRISHNNIEIKSGDSKQLSAFVLPALAENQTILWSSENENIAKISANGLVTGVSTMDKTVHIFVT